MSEKLSTGIWGSLPFLVTRKQALQVTGLSPRDLRKLVHAGVLHRQVCGTRCGKYFKQELEALCQPPATKE